VEDGVAQREVVGEPIVSDAVVRSECRHNRAVVVDAHETLVHVVEQHLRYRLASGATDIEVYGLKGEPEGDDTVVLGRRTG